jgi:DNA-binding NtrC family response regulator
MAETILIVDDEIDILELLELIITDKTGYRVLTSSNPLEVLEIVRSEKPDLLITDLRMPEVDGLELLVEVQRLDPYLPFIVITAYGTCEVALEAMEKGVFDFITKPFRQEQILLTIEKAMKFRRLQKENQALKKELETCRSQQHG